MRPARAALIVLVAGLFSATLAVATGPAVAQVAGPEGSCGPTSRSKPGTVTVRTIPPLPQAKILLDGEPLPAGDDPGTFTAERLCVAGAMDRLSAAEVVTVRPGVRQHFTRWVTSQKNGEITAVYDVQRKVSFRFQRLDGHRVPVEELDEYVIRSSTGGVSQSREPSLWLQSERVIPTPDGLRVKKMYYTVDSVRVDSAEVVYRSQQRFVPAEDNAVSIDLLYFPIRISTRDALFGFPIGSSVLLTHPSGRVSRHPLERGRTVVPALPRGDYTIQVEAAAPVVVRPLALSRPQDVDLAVLSWLDLGTLGGALVLIASSLLLVRRPHLRSPRRYLMARRAAPAAVPRRGRHSATNPPLVMPLQRSPAPEPPPAPRVHHTGWPPATPSRPATAAPAPLGWPEHAEPAGCRPTCTASRGAHSPGCRRTSRADHSTSARAEERT